MAPIKKLFYVVNFMQQPCSATDQFAVVPSKWISYFRKQAMVAFPLFDSNKFGGYIKKRRSPCKSWPVFPVTIEFKSDLYHDATLYVKFRQQMRSSYVRPIHDTELETALSTVLNYTNDSISLENSSLVPASETEALEASHLYLQGSSLLKDQTEKKAMKHELFMKILHKINDVNKLLDDYINL